MKEKSWINTTQRRRRLYSAARCLSRPVLYLSRKWQARRLGRDAPFQIGRAEGFLQSPSGMSPHTGAVVEAARDTVRRFASDPMEHESQKDYLSNRLDPRELTPDHPLVRFALHPHLLQAITRYLRTVPILNAVRVLVSVPDARPPWSSKLFHCDGHDLAQVKVFVYCSEVGPDNGPLTLLDAGTSDRIRDRIGYRYPKRLEDDRLAELVPPQEIRVLTGPAGTICFIDTSRCFHLGSRVAPGAEPRIVALFQYLSPFALTLPREFWKKAELAHLVDDSLAPLQRMVLTGQ